MSDSSELLVIEPRFKYIRYLNYAADIISKDTISCIAVHSKFVVIGTEWGNIHILDHLGYPSSKKEIHAHSTTINQISIDFNGEYIATCSNDGKVMILGLLDDKQYPVLTFNQAIQAIAISPDFKKTFQFITGDTRLLLVSKGILSSQKHKVLQENRTLITNIKWNNDTVIYATSNSVFVYDMKEQRLIGIIDPNKSLVNDPQECYCKISWIDDDTFMIGWGHLIQICIIKDNLNTQTSLKPLDFAVTTKLNISNRKVECLHTINHPDMILGLVPYGKYLLTIVDPISENKLKNDVQENQLIVIVIEPSKISPDGYIEIATDQIIPKGFTALQRKINLEKIPFENQFYIVSSKDLISVKEFEVDDRIKWLIQHKNYEKAMVIVNETDPFLTKYNKKDLGMSYVSYLISINAYQKAALICSNILDDKIGWENVINMFLEINCIKYILTYLPYLGNIILDQEIYKNVLVNCFYNDLTTFLNLLLKWPTNLYPIQFIIDIVNRGTDSTNINQDSNHKVMFQRTKIITKCLGILYENNQEFEKALDCYLRLKDNYIFQLIPKRNMFYIVNSEKLLYLITLDKDRTLKLLMEYIHEVPPENVVKILTPTPIWLFHYLNALLNHNKVFSEPYHSQMVKLYAEFKRENLMSFLKGSDKYDLNAAIIFCQSKGFNKEVIHLLGRVGRSKEALQMIMKQECGEFEAIEYCRERDDEDLWRELMLSSIDKPLFIKAILENTAMDIDAKLFIRKIRNDTEIPRLKDSLVKLLINYEKQNTLISSHQQAKWNDILKMIKQRFQYITKPIICEVSEKNRCIVCQQPIINSMNSIILFRCSHICHKTCFKGSELEVKLTCFCSGN